jgi:hypothetical protein
VRAQSAACAWLVERLGAVDSVIVSSNGTWTDRVEAAALRRTRYRGAVGSVEGYLPELLSAGPLAALAGVLLTGRVPQRLFDNNGSGGSKGARSVGLLASDFAGNCTAVRVVLGTGRG